MKTTMIKAGTSARSKFNKLLATVSCTIFTIMCTTINVLADPTPGVGDDDALAEITNKVDTIKTLVFGVIAVVGGVYAAFSFLKAAKGHKNGDDRQFDQGVTGVIIGVIMTGFGTLMAALGWGTSA